MVFTILPEGIRLPEAGDDEADDSQSPEATISFIPSRQLQEQGEKAILNKLNSTGKKE